MKMKCFSILLALMLALTSAALADDALIATADSYVVGPELFATIWDYQAAAGEEEAWATLAMSDGSGLTYEWTSANADLQAALEASNGASYAFVMLTEEQAAALAEEKAEYVLTVKEGDAVKAQLTFTVVGTLPMIDSQNPTSDPACEISEDMFSWVIKAKAGQTVTVKPGMSYEGTTDTLEYAWAMYDYEGYYQLLDCTSAEYTFEADESMNGRYLEVSARVKGVAYPEGTNVGAMGTTFVLEITK